MYIKPSKTAQLNIFFDPDSQLNQKHPLYLLANKIDRNVIEESFRKLYCENNRQPAKPIRRKVVPKLNHCLLETEDVAEN